jgi:O-antigen ligase
MYADMSSADWVIGKGIKGKYYCPIVDNVNDAEGAGYRDNIETGYLQIILKGGILSLALLLLMFIPAVYFGLFKSKNVLAKASSLWIFLWIVYLYPSGGIVFNMNYVLVWVAAGVCYSEKIRKLTDEEIRPYLQIRSLLN